MTLPNVKFTDVYEPESSSLVDAVYYNDETKQLAVDLDGEVYRYDRVPREVFEAFRVAESAGRFYTPNVKRKFGPGAYLGETYDVDFEAVTRPVAVNTVGGPSGLRERATGGYIGAPVAKPVGSASGAHISLTPARRLATEAVANRFEVVFEVEGTEGRKTHTVTADTLLDAAAEVEDLGAMLGLDFTLVEVRKV